ncbi:MAG: (2Fe-2S)-binding protein [Deltaproteobacteria bacterium]|nr:(2Fe-2S)-binding protein [Deltaproteobacteria bacterium]
MKTILSINVNGNDYEVAINPWQTLLDVLRDELGLIGTKRGCGIGTCGSCTIIMDGKAILSCLTLAIECEGHTLTTIEGISTAESLHPVQQSFIDNGAVQCGYCTPGIVMTAKALLDENPRPDDEEIKDALSGTFCRCTGHIKIMEAVKKVSQPEDEGKE